MSHSKHSKMLAERLSGAVKIATVVHDRMGAIGEDPGWDIFYQFSKFLKTTFPLIHQHLERTTINEHGNLFTWQGSDTRLKPLLLMAHSDVVPASSSPNQAWTYDPFSGYIDSDFVWGRGSEDDKSNLIAILTTLESLLKSSWQPTRTIILSVGFDEEGGADQSYGARCLANHLLHVYGEDGIELVFDEGPGIEEKFGTECALPATAEKGYVDIEMRIDCPGGHSSEPPKHTAIGLLAQAITIIETNQLSPAISIAHPYYQFLEVIAERGKEVPQALRSAIRHQHSIDRLLTDSRLDMKAHELVQTTTAATVIHGGDKVNSLPETAYVLVNHRIAMHDSVRIVKDHYLRLLRPWAKKHNLTFHNFDTFEHILGPEYTGTLTLTSTYDLDPSPVSSTSDPCFSVLEDTLHEVFGTEVMVAPTILAGNTDTRYYWNLSSNIYRMSPFRAAHDPRGSRMHTVDERMPIAGLVEMYHFYMAFIEAVDKFRR